MVNPTRLLQKSFVVNKGPAKHPRKGALSKRESNAISRRTVAGEQAESIAKSLGRTEVAIGTSVYYCSDIGSNYNFM